VSKTTLFFNLIHSIDQVVFEEHRIDWNSLSTMSGPTQGFKTTVQIYRDSLRLIKHIAGDSPKAQNIRNVVRQEFRRNANETNPETIENLKFNAVRGLSNYLVYQASL